MATTAAPYGFKPVGLLSSRPMPHGMRLIRIADSYNTQISTFDAVKCVNTGTVAKDAGTATMTPIGIFMGCSYTDSTLGPIQRAYWPASTNAEESGLPYAYVVDDPEVVMQAQGAATVAQADLFLNAAQVVTAGDTSFGHSKNAIGSQADTNTLPVRIIDFVEGPTSAIGDTYTDVLIIWNHGMHHYRQATGV
jgi:hypothetical protein